LRQIENALRQELILIQIQRLFDQQLILIKAAAAEAEAEAEAHTQVLSKIIILIAIRELTMGLTLIAIALTQIQACMRLAVQLIRSKLNGKFIKKKSFKVNILQ
jgi:hypothetical protein